MRTGKKGKPYGRTKKRGEKDTEGELTVNDRTRNEEGHKNTTRFKPMIEDAAFLVQFIRKSWRLLEKQE